MKKYILLSALQTCAAGVLAQITVTNATFPAIGDTLRTAVDLSPDGIGITPPGGPVTWDFTGLTPDLYGQAIYLDPSLGTAGSSFPGATLLVEGTDESENYYSINDTHVSLQGFKGLYPPPFPMEAVFHYNPPLIERWAPLQFFDIGQTSSGILEAFAWSDLPTAITGSLSLPQIPDSIRIRSAINRLNVVDAYGTMSLPGGDYEVLRQSRTEYVENRIDGKIQPLGWLDITDLAIGSGLWGGAFGVDTLKYYLFVSNTEKEIIARVNFNTDFALAQSIEYIDSSPTPTALKADPAAAIRVYPNPAADAVVFDLSGFPSGEYLVRLTDAGGRVVREQRLIADRDRMSLETLDTGIYFYQLLAADGRQLALGKILVIR